MIIRTKEETRGDERTFFNLDFVSSLLFPFKFFFFFFFFVWRLFGRRIMSEGTEGCMSRPESQERISYCRYLKRIHGQKLEPVVCCTGLALRRKRDGVSYWPLFVRRQLKLLRYFMYLWMSTTLATSCMEPSNSASRTPTEQPLEPLMNDGYKQPLVGGS
jgi:hypothetical protein